MADEEELLKHNRRRSKPPKGKESNWLYTPAGQKWFPWFRVYGPEKAILDKSWRLPDIERIN